MKVVFIARATLHEVKGGDSFQIMETARHLEKLGVAVDVRLTHEKIRYEEYDLLHFFNIIRPADILYHIRRSGKPFVVSTLLIDYSGYDKYYRKGLSGLLCRLFSADTVEYLKTMGRYLSGRDKLVSKNYLWKGQQRSVREILKGASLIFPNSMMEYKRLLQQYNCPGKDIIPIPNGLDTGLFVFNPGLEKDEDLVICVARIEGIKNQMNLIRALNNTRYKLLIIGDHAPGHAAYYQECRRIAAPNVQFIPFTRQHELVKYYQRAKVHILPSWWETCGLSSLEAGAMGCNLVITDKGYTREYYEELAFYCDPASPASIFDAVDHAAHAPLRHMLRKKILTNYTWGRAAASLANAYDQIMHAV